MNLLPDENAVIQALTKLHEHLLPEGRILIPLEIQREKIIRSSVGRFKEQRQADGSLIRCGAVDYAFDDEAQHTAIKLRYERQQRDGSVESLERDWQLKWWYQAEFQQMLEMVGFCHIRCRDEKGEPASPDASFFSFTASPAE